MEIESQDNHAPPAGEETPEAGRTRAKRGLWGAVFPEILGVALIVTLVASVVGVGAFAYLSMRAVSEEAQLEKGQAVANVIAAALAPAVDRDDSEAEKILRQICAKIHAMQTAEWRRPDGTTRCGWPGADGTAPSLAEAATISLETAVQSVAGTPAGVLSLTLTPSESVDAWVLLLCGSGAVSIAGLLAYFVVYRRLRRHMRPMEAIQRNLTDYADGVEKEFVALSLSDSLGHIAQSWNHLIDQLATLRDQETETTGADFTGDALRRFESRTLRSTLDRLPIGLLRFGPELSASYVNIAAARLLGRSREDITNVPLSEFLDEEVSTPLIGAYMRSSASMSIDRKRGLEEQQTTLRFSIIPADSSSPDREALLTIEDVSHFLEAERARDNFLYHVTHELRTPLTNIQAYAETLTGPDFDDEETRRECYNVIISETRRLSRLVEDILNVSQLEVGTACFEMGRVDLVRLLRQIVQDHLGAADEKRIDLTLKLAPKVPEIQGDKQRLAVLFTNLVGNAIKYTPEDGRVDVTLEVGEHCVDITVADTGIGITAEDQGHVFDKFYRAVSDEVQMIKGTGLGLAIAREVARLHGGDIRLESELSKGSRFKIELPYGGADE